jgi:hypothetical protein
MAEALRFYVDGDIVVEMGKDKKSIAIPRITFGDMREVVNYIAAVASADVATTVDVMAQQWQSKAATVVADGSLKDLSTNIGGIVAKVLKEKNIEQVSNLAGLLSSQAITPALINECQYTEICDVVRYLVDANFGALKNLSASLQTTASSARGVL